MHIRTNDIVEVTTGADRGTRAKVLRVMADDHKIIVEGVARVYKHVRRSQQNPRGGRLSKEMPIAISNVALVCPGCDKATRTGAKLHDDGSKSRVCKNCGKDLGQISPAKKKKQPATTRR